MNDLWSANSIKYMSYLHKDKIRICLRGFGWTQFASRDSISYETRREYLSSRHKYRKLTTLYKMLISLCRQTLGNCLPLTVYNINDHNLRKDENCATPWAGGYWSSLRKCFGRKTMTWLTLWNICVINDHGYISMVASTSRSFPRSWLF